MAKVCGCSRFSKSKGVSMKWYSISAFMISALFQSATAATAVSISGTVTKTGGGAVKDVTCTLAGVSGLTAKTDASGKFTLDNGASAIMPSAQARPVTFHLNGRELSIHSTDKEISGTVSVYNQEGKRISSVDFQQTNSSVAAISLPSVPTGLNILKITVNGKSYTSQLLQLPSLSARLEGVSGPSASNQLVLLRSAADPIVDTLITKKSGFVDKRTPISSYNLSDLSITMDSIVVTTCNAATLKAAGLCRPDHQILLGTALSANNMPALAAQEFNFVTPENEMKWESVERTEGSFSFTSADNIVNWAQQNNMKVKGHCLVWHSQLPSWVSSINSKDRLLAVMKKHIETVMGRWGNKLHSWDVVNEALFTDSDAGTGNAKMRASVFSNLLGEDYIPTAFKMAREYADKNNMKSMKLYYNDYSIDADNDKSRFLRKKIKEWLAAGAPIDGIGFQMHIGPPNNIPTVQAVKDNMDYYASLGLEVLISEWDINLCGSKVSTAQQTEFYRGITQACVNNPKCSAITFWGVNDQNSWLNSFSGSLCNGANSQSLLFSNGQKKAVYSEVLNGLNGK
ncbi:MAG: endo-1,4-beta-xylanase [Fibrobacterota bacterium]|nr:MAG: endo-1,4-beta-xylanase [Fibrobacterota bacterium]